MGGLRSGMGYCGAPDIETPKKNGKFTKITCTDDTHVVVEGCDKHDVGQTAALIYDSHRPDVYGQKGVHYKGQHLIKKVGKRAAATGAKK